MKINKNFIIWLFLVALWNFGVPQAAPIFDVLAATILFFLSRLLEERFQ